MHRFLKWLIAIFMGLATLAFTYYFFRYPNGSASIWSRLPGIPLLMILVAITIVLFA